MLPGGAPPPFLQWMLLVRLILHKHFMGLLGLSLRLPTRISRTQVFTDTALWVFTRLIGPHVVIIRLMSDCFLTLRQICMSFYCSSFCNDVWRGHSAKNHCMEPHTVPGGLLFKNYGCYSVAHQWHHYIGRLEFSSQECILACFTQFTLTWIYSSLMLPHLLCFALDLPLACSTFLPLVLALHKAVTS